MLRHAEPVILPFAFWGTTAGSYLNGALILATLATGDYGGFTIPIKCEVQEAGAVVKTGFVGASIASAQLKFDKRVNAGSDTNRGDGDIAQLYFGTTGASAQGACVYDLAGQGVMLEPGQEVVVENMYAGTNISAGAVWPYLLVKHMPEVRTNLTRMKETL